MKKVNENQNGKKISKEEAIAIFSRIRENKDKMILWEERHGILPEIPFNFNFLTFAAFCGNHIVVQSMDVLNESWESELDGMNALHLATLNDKVEIVKYLLKHIKDRDINATCDGKLTALHIACRESSNSCLKLLLENEKIKINLKSDGGFTPLHFACFNSNLEAVKLLIDKGADKNITDLKGRRPIDLIKDRNDEISNKIKELLTSR